MAQQADGKLLVVGNTPPGIVRLNTDGNLDPTFSLAAPPDSEIRGVGVQPDGRIIVAGQFRHIGGVPASQLARLNADGSVDSTFAAVTEIQSTGLEKLILQKDGGIILLGFLFAIDVPQRNGIARFNADGRLDAFHPILDGTIDIALPDRKGKLVLGGSFGQINGVLRNGIARVNADGSLDAAFDPAANVGRTVMPKALQPDGRMIVVGDFANENIRRLTRLKRDGTLDPTFQSPSSMRGSFDLVAVQVDGRIVIVGNLAVSQDEPVSEQVVRLDADGSLDASFRRGIPGSTSLGIRQLALTLDRKILIVGDFASFNGSLHGGIVRLNEDGSVDETFQLNRSTQPNSFVQSAAPTSGGKTVVAGAFTGIGGRVRPGVARLLRDGTVDPTFIPALPGTLTALRASVQSDGKTIVLGSPVDFSGAAGIVRLNRDGTLDPTFSADAFSTNTTGVDALVQPDGRILVVTSTYSRGQASFGAITRLNPDGKADSSFQAGARDLSVLTMALQPDGKILVGGSGQFYNASAPSLLRLNGDGSRDEGFVANPDFVVNAIAVQPDGKILAGRLSAQSNMTGPHLVRLNADGSPDLSFDEAEGPDNTVRQIAVQADGRILIGGDFQNVAGISQSGIARLNEDGSLDPAYDACAGLDVSVSTLYLQPDGKATISGGLQTADGTRDFITRLNEDGSFDSGFTVKSAPEVSVKPKGGSVSVSEGGVMKFLVERNSLNLTSDLRVEFKLKGAARNGSDYQTLPESAVIPAGTSRLTIKLHTNDNAVAEGDRTVKLKLTPTEDYEVGSPAKAEITIRDND